jgi:hypothetical protein
MERKESKKVDLEVQVEASETFLISLEEVAEEEARLNRKECSQLFTR